MEFAMKKYAQEWIAEIEQMFKETFPKAEEMLQTIVVEFVPARKGRRQHSYVERKQVSNNKSKIIWSVNMMCLFMESLSLEKKDRRFF